jgi:hypothetical protein
MRKFFHFAFTAILFSVVFTGNVLAADREEAEKLIYGSDRYDGYRKITYWGRAYLSIYDYHYKSEDVEHLKLIVKDKTKKIESDSPREDIKQHFMGEFKNLFIEKFGLPFHDNEIGYNERLEKVLRENRELSDPDFYEKFVANEVARRRAQYGGNPGSVFCHIQVKRRTFPVLYTIRCCISAEEDLSYSRRVEKEDIGFSSPEYIGGELKAAITQMLKEISLELSKIKKYGK